MATGQIYFGNTLISDIQLNLSGWSQWSRPTDWLPLPTAQPDSIKILNAVFDQFENFAAVRMVTTTGNYQVDWGDGTIDVVASNGIAEHNYDFSNPALNGTLTSRGYKQAIISVTPVSGAFAFAFLNTKATTPAGLSNYSSKFLDMNINLPNLTGNLTIGGGIVLHSLLERANITSWGNITSLDNLFANCSNLQSVNETEWDLSNITNISNIFSNANALKALNCTNWDLSNCNSAINAFNGCNSLQQIQLPTTGFAANANLSSMFGNCVSLTTLDLSMLDVSNVTNMLSIFYRCLSLQEINLTGWNTANVGNVSNMFINCYALRKIPALDFGAVTNFASFLFGCRSLVSMKATGIKENVSFLNCLLGASALDEIYTNLATVTGKTITVTGNYGTATDNPSIAEAKGWTVVS